MNRTVFGSVTRIADLEATEFEVVPLDLKDWSTGDYVAGTVTGETTSLYQIETADGQMLPVSAGDRVIGAFGDRAATLEAAGGFRDIRSDGHMNALTSAGLIGRVTSTSPLKKPHSPSPPHKHSHNTTQHNTTQHNTTHTTPHHTTPQRRRFS